MSGVRIVYLYCDGPLCDGVSEPFRASAGPGETLAMQRKWARREGWTRRNGKDLCPECRQESS